MSTVQKTRMHIFSKISTFYSKIAAEAPIFNTNKLCPDDPSDKLFPLVKKLNLKTNFLNNI